MDKPKCPYCGSDGYVVAKNTAQKIGIPTGGTVGFLARLMSRAAAAAGGWPAAVAGLLAGALTGQKLGQLLDEHVLRAFTCLKCGRTINL